MNCPPSPHPTHHLPGQTRSSGFCEGRHRSFLLCNEGFPRAEGGWKLLQHERQTCRSSLDGEKEEGFILLNTLRPPTHNPKLAFIRVDQCGRKDHQSLRGDVPLWNPTVEGDPRLVNLTYCKDPGVTREGPNLCICGGAQSPWDAASLAQWGNNPRAHVGDMTL